MIKGDVSVNKLYCMRVFFAELWNRLIGCFLFELTF